MSAPHPPLVQALLALAPEVAGPAPPGAAALRDRLYATLHCRVSWPARTRAGSPAPAFEEQLHRANHGTGSWQDGWTVHERLPEGLLHLSRDGLPVWARPDRVRGDAQVGTAVAVRLPNALRRFSPGYYVAIGDAVRGDHVPHVRCYWHLRAEGAPVLLDAATKLLNQAELAFRIKVLLDDGRYPRTDAGVLYLPVAGEAVGWEVVRELHARVAPHLMPDTSLLVHRVAPGLGAADDVAGGASFGLGRARVLADVLLALGARAHDATQVSAALLAAGIDPARPYAHSATTRFPSWA